MRELTGTLALARQHVRRDRIRYGLWIIGIVGLVVVTAASTKGIYPSQASLDLAARLAEDNPAVLAFNGPAQALDTMGGQVAFQIGAFGLLTVALMALLLLGRATRGEEDSGRLELVRSMPVGRYAPLAAALLVVSVLCVVVGALVTLSLVQEDLPLHGSIVFGASYTVLGLLFLALTAVSAQVSENPRVAAGVAGAVLGASFALRALGDAGSGSLSWVSPIGWAQKARPYAGERWWPLALCLVVAVGLVWLAAVLAERRDFGSGMVPPRPGPPRADARLRSPLGLALRLHRGAVLWWCVGVTSMGAVYGTLAQSIGDFVSDDDTLRDLVAAYGGANLVDSYLTTSLLIVTLIASGPGLHVAVRLRSEEVALRAEAMLATPASRWQWAGSHLVVALGGSALATVLGGLGLGTAHALTGGGAGEVPRLVAASLVYVPATWVLTAVAAALFGVASRATPAAWPALAGCFVIGMFGPILDLPGWVRDLSPFQHTPTVPADDLQVLPIALLLLVATGLLAVGLGAFRARDLVSS